VPRNHIRDTNGCISVSLACRGNGGNKQLINELVRVVYLADFLQKAGFGELPIKTHKLAESAIETILAGAVENGKWTIAYNANTDSDFTAGSPTL
jgi:hypothetical protein